MADTHYETDPRVRYEVDARHSPPSRYPASVRWIKLLYYWICIYLVDPAAESRKNKRRR